MPDIPGSNGRFVTNMDVVDLVVETVSGDVHHLSGDNAFDFLDDLEALLIDDDCAQLQLNVHDSVQYCTPTTEVPMSWVNRLVCVKLDIGEVMGVLSDESLRDCTHAHLTALPGCPAIAPLPRDDVRGVVLVGEALHVSFCRSGDGQVNVWRWLHQEEESIWVRELHMDSEAQKTVGRQTCEVSAALKFHLWYERGSTTMFFSRFPACDASGEQDKYGAAHAHLSEWRMQWRNPIMHLMTHNPSSIYLHSVEIEREPLTDDVVQENVADDAIQENLTENSSQARDSCPSEDYHVSVTNVSIQSCVAFTNELWPTW
jgi:hypothetical protein